MLIAAKDLNLIHSSQAGFQAGRSCQEQIANLIRWLQQYKNRAAQERTARIPVRQRTQQFVIMLDKAKAFDNLNRRKLIEILKDRNFPLPYVKIMQSLLSDTQALIDG